MKTLIQQHREQIETLCRKHGVRMLELFGSGARDDFDPLRSDLDFFYEFDSDPSRLSDRFFGLLEDLEALLQRKVDLVSSVDARNPYFLATANRHRMTIYES